MSQDYSLAERIVLCIDACEEPYTKKQPIVVGGKPFSTFEVIKKCAEAFLKNKSSLNPGNEFAIVFNKSTTRGAISFTPNVKFLMRELRSAISEHVSTTHSTDLSSFFNVLDMRELEDTAEGKPIRIVILFGRPGSYIRDDRMPVCTSELIVDVIYFHKTINSAKEKKRVETNFNTLLSCVGDRSVCKVTLAYSYKVFEHTADLLIHPHIRL